MRYYRNYKDFERQRNYSFGTDCFGTDYNIVVDYSFGLYVNYFGGDNRQRPQQQHNVTTTSLD